MKKKKGIVGLIVILAILLLGIGYAIVNQTLTINGTLSASANNDNFIVEFDNSNGNQPTKTCTVSGATTSATYTSNKAATFNVANFTVKGDTATFEYEIVNKSTSEDLIAGLDVNISTNLNNEYFSVTKTLDKTEIDTTEKAKLTVTVTMIKTPIDQEHATAAAATGTITIQAEAKHSKTN